MTEPNHLTEQRRVAWDFLSRLLEEAMESGNVPQPSAFGVQSKDDPEIDPVYDWCQEVIGAFHDEPFEDPDEQED